MQTTNLLTKDQLKPEFLCALCSAILVDPVQCKSCKYRFHHKCLEKFFVETESCPMQCQKPKFLSVKKEVEKKLIKMQFKCKNHSSGCTKVLQYLEVASHDEECPFEPIKCDAYKACHNKCTRKEIEQHQAVCPYVNVPCIYCKKRVMRMNIIAHEQGECPGTYVCEKCGMTVQKLETQNKSHNCFTAMAGYLSNMLESKDYIIEMFRDEIKRKNAYIEDLLEKQDYLETRLTKIEAVLLFDDKDLEAQTGIKREDDINGEEIKFETKTEKDDDTTKISSSESKANSTSDAAAATKQEEEAKEEMILSEEEMFEQTVLSVEEEWRDLYREGHMYIEQVQEELFNPRQKWNQWQKTKNYLIETRISENGLLMCHSTTHIEKPLQRIWDLIVDYGRKGEYDPNYMEGDKIKEIGPRVSLHYLKTKKIAVVSSRDQYLIVANKVIEADKSPTGNKILIIGSASKDLEQYPPIKGVVRAETKISGYYIEEVEAGKACDVHFLVESDFKVSFFIQKQMAPKSSNYSNFLREWFEKYEPNE